ncbi:energy transducer TonB [Beijerinckia sp. L45]|uniref:energy transducer TonB n=1 Tax=Beijerinckia sp. L45 TaxID=1641855 RepID=UPI00131D83F0|nr:TonB family protein [Beijerinckia sp. L45]
MSHDVVTAHEAEPPVGDDETQDVGDDDRPSDLVADDRLAMLDVPPAIARRFGMLLPVVVISLAVHFALFAVFVLLVKEPPPISEQQETPVEIVQEPPPKAPEVKPEPKKEPPPAAPKPDEKPAAAEPPKPPEPAKTEPAKPEPVKPEAPKQSETRQEPAKPASAAPEKPVQAAPEKPPMAKPPAAPQPEPDKAAEDAEALKSLQNELAALKAQAADLRAQAALHPQADRALGLLPDSFAAVAVPNLSDDGENPVTYQQAVYGLIAKAKKSGRVFVPGVAHVVFNIGSKGELLDVTLDHPSGNAIVDEEAVAIVRRAAPFPPPPPGAPRSFPAYMSFVADQ